MRRRRTQTEEKKKVVAAAWGTEFNQFLAAVAVLHKDDLKNRMNFFKSAWCKIASAARN